MKYTLYQLLYIDQNMSHHTQLFLSQSLIQY